jgi:hypothetical protein
MKVSFVTADRRNEFPEATYSGFHVRLKLLALAHPSRPSPVNILLHDHAGTRSTTNRF